MRGPLRCWSAAAVVVAVALAGCTAAPKVADDRVLTWRALSADGLGADQRVAVFLSTFPDTDAPSGYLGLIDGEGETAFLATEPHDNGLLAARGGVLCATDRLATYRLSASGALKAERGGYERSSGHWSGLRDDGTCVSVLNSGMGEEGYETDVYWEDRGRLQHSVVPDVPGPTGQSPGAVWVRNGSITKIPGVLALYRTDLRTGKTVKVMSWPTRSEKRDGRQLRFDDGHATDLFWHDGRLVYLEDLSTVDGQGQRTEVEPGFHAELRLASIDPATRRYDSTFLGVTVDGLRAPSTPKGAVNPAAVAMRAGHLHADTLFSANADGEIIGVDLETKSLRVVGRLSQDAARAAEAAAAWEGDRLFVVLVAADGAVTLETYELTSGKRVSSQSVLGWNELTRSGQVYLSSAAVVGAS